jgi:hypothetical protein
VASWFLSDDAMMLFLLMLKKRKSRAVHVHNIVGSVLVFSGRKPPNILGVWQEPSRQEPGNEPRGQHSQKDYL